MHCNRLRIGLLATTVAGPLVLTPLLASGTAHAMDRPEGSPPTSRPFKVTPPSSRRSSNNSSRSERRNSNNSSKSEHVTDKRTWYEMFRPPTPTFTPTEAHRDTSQLTALDSLTLTNFQAAAATHLVLEGWSPDGASERSALFPNTREKRWVSSRTPQGEALYDTKTERIPEFQVLMTNLGAQGEHGSETEVSGPAELNTAVQQAGTRGGVLLVNHPGTHLTDVYNVIQDGPGPTMLWDAKKKKKFSVYTVLKPRASGQRASYVPLRDLNPDGSIPPLPTEVISPSSTSVEQVS